MRIVVGYLQTPQGEAALERAIEEAQLRSAELVIAASVRVTEHQDPATYQRITTHLESVGKRVEAAGVPHRIRELPRGATAADDLLRVVDEEKADLLVIGLRRRSPVGKLVLGSNSQDVLLNASCPVLAVKAAEDEP